ncbi:uncharacterized protein LOC125833298 [Solanum verrucosum]|uniref:uncharacterized protein LOC125833298 n=1 Tax=Solanum verrucosum TaxID=315347 RepID=UPI0020D09F41|nr:uncharacterized protein LOC125833298 [Solanum verrucosum]
MAKAYDRVSWKYLVNVIRKFGFSERIIDMIVRVISNNWYSVLLNGQTFGFFQSSRGLKQGDLLSPTQFIIAAEVLARNLNKLFEDGEFKGFGLPKWSPQINHLSYADDMILFCSGQPNSIRKMMNVLRRYETISGQMINLDKNYCYLHDKVPAAVGNRIKRITGVRQAMKPPTGELFVKFSGKMLRGPGRSTGTSTSSLWSAFMWNKYCKKHHPVIAIGWGASHVWRKMIVVREEVEHNIWWQIRAGTSSFWFDNWTRMGALYYIENGQNSEEEVEVHEFTIEGRWDEQKLNTILSTEMVEYIIESTKPPSTNSQHDQPWWMANTQGDFTVKSAWKILRRKHESRADFGFIWTKGLPFKINFFLWRMWKGRIPTDDNLKRMKI